MSFIAPDSFFHAINTTNATSHPPTTVFFITGNPGLIGYYHTFLSLLSSRLTSISPSQAFHIYGHSLVGFELDPESGKDEKQQQQQQQQPDGSPESKYYNLEEQICYVQRRLDDFVAQHGGKRGRVILIGHSLGAYIAMEVLRRHRERQQARGTDSTAEFDIIGGVLLFPTIVDIAKSPAGQRLTKLFNLIPQLALVATSVARLLTALVPGGLLRSLVATFMGLSPSSSPSEAGIVDSTCDFLKSKRGVRQALHLGADEMQTITSDKWSDDIWGIPRVQEPLARLFFYFGRNDHWVAERTRDEIIAVRGRAAAEGTGGPTMVVCEDGLPHAFCMRHNEIMARKTADMIRAIVGSQL